MLLTSKDTLSNSKNYLSFNPKTFIHVVVVVDGTGKNCKDIVSHPSSIFPWICVARTILTTCLHFEFKAGHVVFTRCFNILLQNLLIDYSKQNQL